MSASSKSSMKLTLFIYRLLTVILPIPLIWDAMVPLNERLLRQYIKPPKGKKPYYLKGFATFFLCQKGFPH
jgi:hypothetical protein